MDSASTGECAVMDEDICAVLGERNRNVPADAPGAACDKDGLVQ